MTTEQEIIQFMSLLNDPKFVILFALYFLWVAIWKGIALWKSAKNNSIPWFIALFLINTVGILEIVYIFYFSKNKNQREVK